MHEHSILLEFESTSQSSCRYHIVYDMQKKMGSSSDIHRITPPPDCIYRDSAFAFLKWPDPGMLMTGCQKPIFTNGALPGWMMTHVILMGSFVKASNVSVGC